MVAKRSRNGLAKSAKMAVDKWLDLPSDPLFKIFTKLNPIDMLLVVPLVCKNWGRILCEMLFYDNNNNSLNFRPLQHYAPFCSIFCGWGDDRSRAIKLMNLLVSVMHVFASDGDVGTSAVRATPINYIAFPPDLRLYDKHLVYIAERYNYYPFNVLYCYMTKNWGFVNPRVIIVIFGTLNWIGARSWFS